MLAISANEYAKTGKEIISENNFPAKVDPMLKTHWSQDGGENCKLPYVENGIQAVTGCGATALAQILNYWKYPSQGYGFNYYFWQEEDSGKEQLLYANFQNTIYKWSNMADIYKGNSKVTSVQKDAVGILMEQIGVALQMNYKYDCIKERPETATQIEYIHTVLKKFFGYNRNMCLYRYINGAYTMDEWLKLIYKELAEGRPVLMGGRLGSANHIFVADGYDKEGRIHLNLGHG